MANKSRKIVKLVSTADTGYFYTTYIPTKAQYKLNLKKYDPVVRKHVLFEQKKV